MTDPAIIIVIAADGEERIDARSTQWTMPDSGRNGREQCQLLGSGSSTPHSAFFSASLLQAHFDGQGYRYQSQQQHDEQSRCVGTGLAKQFAEKHLLDEGLASMDVINKGLVMLSMPDPGPKEGLIQEDGRGSCARLAGRIKDRVPTEAIPFDSSITKKSPALWLVEHDAAGAPMRPWSWFCLLGLLLSPGLLGGSVWAIGRWSALRWG